MKYLILILAPFLLLSCSHYPSNSESQYMRSTNGVPLEIPQGLSNKQISPFYNLPPQNNKMSANITPPATN